MKQDSNFPEVHQEYRRGVIFAVIIFALIVAGMFMFAYLEKSDQQQTAPPPNGEEPVSTDDQYSYIDRINGTHYFIDGVHTVVGEIPMPTPCDLLEADMIVAESYPEQITIEFSVINNAEICAQMITPARFKVSAPASASSTFSARFMGRPIELNLMPAPEGETPDDFEIFTKG